MEIKSIEKQGDIVTVKMTMPSCCGECPFFPDDIDGNDYCRLLAVLYQNAKFVISEKCNNYSCYNKENCDNTRCKYALNNESIIPEFCPLRCNNG